MIKTTNAKLSDRRRKCKPEHDRHARMGDPLRAEKRGGGSSPASGSAMTLSSHRKSHWITVTVNEYKLPNTWLHELKLLLELRSASSTHSVIVLSNATDTKIERESDIAK
jgi:hypothetical protein